jgi:endonuclease YncB( thermonuclease family)
MGCIHSRSDYFIPPHLSISNDNIQSVVQAIYPDLPSSYEKHKVIKVYDGDTVTIEDNRRVRFLGIDTPELNEKQPFAKEARDYVVKKCHNKYVYFSFEPGSDKTDRYGRLLAWVWIEVAGATSNAGNKKQSSSSYLNVNEGLVSEGLANVYTPGNKKLQNHSKLISLQKMARERKIGKWKSFKDVHVYKTKNGKAFHIQNCKHLAKSSNLERILSSSGTDRGLYPCRTCLPDM